MTDLSPAAQNVINVTAEQVLADRRINMEHIAAAALRAVADQVVPKTPSPSYPDDFESGAYEANQWARMRLLSIAAELEGLPE
jgi:hypothetical protein